MTTLTAALSFREEAEEQSYRVVNGPHGNLIFGPVPIGDMVALSTAWEASRGLNVLDLGVAGALGATFCATSREGGAAWRAEIDRSAAKRAGGDRELEWAWGTDAGYSSMTILYVLGQSERARNVIRSRLARTQSDTGTRPSDPDDLGRCIRLLDIFPAWREKLGEVAAAFPAWAPLVGAWQELESLYREEEPTGKAPRTYQRMQELLGEQREE